MYNTQMNDVVDWLLKLCKNLNIKVTLSPSWLSNWPSRSLASLRLIYYNPNWNPRYELPISLAHEMGHVITESPDYNQLNSEVFNLKVEDAADVIAIQLILKYINLHDLHFETETQLAETFAIPYYMLHDLDLVVKHQEQLKLLTNSTEFSNEGLFSLSM
ncbi:ImmA/IrrE family metallo-endopeptidase [Limosilactobacillus fastidiosus]|uniref:ImmA/IrrE family metallo-endopeptidase n=1 Tax=Limosilactobacillus fastidiosus TaxID=2759855 RepID=A0A7W3TY68_9LACO|nr:ImmA/IrrE family metallo-endopeptidase [Limosilactobacillus fastidiosus]MBB1063162.1 ImmA/IrrE family metallo-endopeptidase [Limosilactobacillus fastidiosus]MBB1085422.1 ImmA/IrrE family metallo-endopeptidase [Limosilactobacillus fastidiosus]MCD7083723.1 ImmA/IrrE family metallo-endopeptidase [Limosilactobacillus fastidiosus]MCD7085404.1 ImmA/IrrE family metallo-endopeptidase [Limosilactobacillus fastidiosus]MCD7114831.1 ImmA/IrrE family metallo-endopeptidase [Limosilactobacillus fastidiosu